MRLKNLSPLFFLIFLALGLQYCANNNSADTAQTEAQETPETEIAQQEVMPPLENIDVPFQKFSVSPAEGTTLKMDNGSSIEIPADAFVNEAGEPVNEPVELQYREFHNAAEIVASGIPMSVMQEDGSEAWMQTAGMFEIKAYADNQEVQLADNKAITVNMASSEDGAYNFWYFDPAAGNWDVKGNSTPVANEQRTETEQQYAQLAAQASQAPIPPVGYDANKVALNFNINYSKFPEIRDLKGIVWQYAGEDKEASPKNNSWIFEESWDDISLEEGDKAGQYELKLASSHESYAIPVFASQTGADLERAQANYQLKMQEYQELKQLLADTEAMREQQLEFTRSFSLNNFGIYNYDILLKRNNDVKLLADFDFGDMPLAMKKLITVYLITGDSRSVVYLPYSRWDRFAFNPDLDNKIMAILPGNKIATFSQEDFEAQKEAMYEAQGGKYLFKMKVDEKPVKNLADVEQKMMVAG